MKLQNQRTYREAKQAALDLLTGVDKYSRFELVLIKVFSEKLFKNGQWVEIALHSRNKEFLKTNKKR